MCNPTRDSTDGVHLQRLAKDLLEYPGLGYIDQESLILPIRPFCSLELEAAMARRGLAKSDLDGSLDFFDRVHQFSIIQMTEIDQSLPDHVIHLIAE